MQGVSSNVVVLVAQPEFSSVLEGSPRSRFAQQKAPTSSFWVASKVGASVASDSIDVVLSSKIASTLVLNNYDSLIQYNTIQYDVTTVVNFFYLYCEL